MNYDKTTVGNAARGRWRWILEGLGFSPSSLAGQHGPCPKCGGTDRFRFTDFEGNGSAVCNQCFAERNGDGFACLMWFHGWPFDRAVNEVGKLLRLSPDGTVAANVPTAKPPETRPKKNPFEAWQPLDLSADERQREVTTLAEAKGVCVDSLLASEFRVGQFPKRGGHKVLGFEAWGYRDGQLKRLGLHLVRADGEWFPERGQMKARKTHNVAGSEFGWVIVGGRERFKRANTIHRVEGLTDGFALWAIVPPDHTIATGSTGAKTVKHVEIYRDKHVVVHFDADRPGRDGAIKFAKAVKAVAASVTMCVLPYEIAETHGKDLRDWIGGEPKNYSDVKKLFRPVGQFEVDVVLDQMSEPQPDLPVCNYEIVGEGKQARPEPLPISEIKRRWMHKSESWPRRQDGMLFVDAGAGPKRIQWLPDESALLEWAGELFGYRPEFRSGSAFHNAKEIAANFRRTAISYDSIESMPHEPRMPDTYYACESPADGDGSHLRWLLDRFSVASPVDWYLIQAMFLTLFSGVAGGLRPAFMVTGNGRGAGKTTLVKIASMLVGGSIEIDLRESVEKIRERLLSPVGRVMRLVLADNLKTFKLSSPGLESLITSKTISGKQLYVGEAQRPNTLTWIFTMNGASLSRDMAERCVVIQLARPQQYLPKWEEETVSYVEKHRDAIVGDLLAMLKREPGDLSIFSRWATWERRVLSLVGEPNEAAAVIKERRGQVDVDGDESETLRDYFAKRIADLKYAETDAVFIPSQTAANWVGKVQAEKVSVSKSTRILKQQRVEGGMPELSDRTRIGGSRGFVWSQKGEFVVESVLMDIEDRIARHYSGQKWEA